MIHTSLLSIVTFIYFASFLFYLFSMLFVRNFWGRLASLTALTGLVGQTAALIVRWKTSYNLGFGHVPMSNFYESLIFFAWAVVLLYLIMEWRLKNRTIGLFVLPVAFLLMAYASMSNISNHIEPLLPALQSNWLISHVLTCFLGYAAFTMAFAFGIIFYMQKLPGPDENKTLFFRLLPAKSTLEDLMYKSVIFGFIFLTMGIIIGSIWAHYAWGSYWSWDPKETWSFITWLIYALMLHARQIRGWQERSMALMTIIGFSSVLFTYFGVNMLQSLHNYIG
ncbi:MAG: c-type cytochrome biogenesis protein CcsB [Smithella sp.]